MFNYILSNALKEINTYKPILRNQQVHISRSVVILILLAKLLMLLLYSKNIQNNLFSKCHLLYHYFCTYTTP